MPIPEPWLLWNGNMQHFCVLCPHEVTASLIRECNPSLLGFCSPIKDVAASIRHTPGSSCFCFFCFLNEFRATHHFVYSFIIKGAWKSLQRVIPGVAFRNTEALARWFMFPTIYSQGILWSMIEATALESGVQFGWGKAAVMYPLLRSQNVLNGSLWTGENDRNEKRTNLSRCQYYN